MNFQKKLLLTATFILTTGIAGMVPYAGMWAENRAALASPQPVVVSAPIVPAKPDTVMGKPVHLSVPSLGIELAVADGAHNVQTGEWTLSKTMAHYALPTTQPNNQTGNTLIYGHNRNEVFTKLLNVQPGAKAIVTTDNGYRFTYTYTSTEAVDPTNLDIFTYEGAPRLTLQTCSGAWYQNRQFFYFEYTSYDKV